MLKKTAQIISLLFHPVLIPTLGFILMFNCEFYFSVIPWEAKRFVLMVVFFSTAILPMLAITLLTLNPKFDISLDKNSDRLLTFLFTSAFYYLGSVLLGRVQVYPVFKILFIAWVLVIITVLIISLKWKISSHMAAIGSLTGVVFTLAFQTKINPVLPLLSLVLVSGITGSARIILGKNNLAQILSGYLLGVLIVSLVIYFT
jgi:hypothetical protein